MCDALQDAYDTKLTKQNGATDVTLFIEMHEKRDEGLPVAGWELTTPTELPQRGDVSGFIKRERYHGYAVHSRIRR